MKCVVTGAAGFIGSHLCEALLQQGHDVVGIDGFIPYYPADIKRRNLQAAQAQPAFHFHALDMRSDHLDAAVAGAEVVFHVGAMAGLLKSWTDFDGYWTCNVQATQRLCEALRRTAP